MQQLPALMEKLSKNAPWLSMKPGLGQKAAVVAAEAAGTAAADMVEAGVAVDMVTNVVVVAAAVDTVTDAVAEIAEDGAAADKSLIFENLVVRTVEHLVKRS
jgi:uroporphyrinogen-III decarboxylase